jgi:hypothetical protein
MNLSKIFTNKNRWHQNGRAINKDGTNFSFTKKWKEDVKEPMSFSLHGAVTYYSEAESQSRSKIMSRLSKAIEIYTGKNLFVAEFNDSPDTSFEDIQNVIKIYNRLQS